MGRVNKTNQNLTPPQKKVKKPRPVYYAGDKKNLDPDLACDILTLYITCKLGYSPIRHIIGAKNDHCIEDVVRQHMLGRKDVDGEKGELCCPGSKTIEEYYVPVIRHLVHKYNTAQDPYILEMFEKGTWKDHPAYEKKLTNCPRCNKDIESEWKLCPFCGYQLKSDGQKKLF